MKRRLSLGWEGTFLVAVLTKHLTVLRTTQEDETVMTGEFLKRPGSDTKHYRIVCIPEMTTVSALSEDLCDDVQMIQNEYLLIVLFILIFK